MSFQQLLAWISVAQIDECRPDDVLKLVEAALDDMDENDPRYEDLLDIEDLLSEGTVPADLLSGLNASDESGRDLDDVKRLDRAYRALAAAYPPERLRSNHYVELERHLEESEEDELFEFARNLRARLTKAWTRYTSDYASVSAASAETVVSHDLMKEGYESWMRALDLIEKDGDDEDVLEAAEDAIRLLVVVGQIDRDVKMQTNSLGTTFRTTG